MVEDLFTTLSSLFGNPATSARRSVALRSPASRRGCLSRSEYLEDAPVSIDYHIKLPAHKKEPEGIERSSVDEDLLRQE
jgi:hypothetical protein